jgi:hypothetical protein
VKADIDLSDSESVTLTCEGAEILSAIAEIQKDIARIGGTGVNSIGSLSARIREIASTVTREFESQGNELRAMTEEVETMILRIQFAISEREGVV